MILSTRSTNRTFDADAPQSLPPNHRILNFAEVEWMGVEHEIDDEGNNFGEESDAVVDLLAIDFAGVGGAAVDDLIAQDVESIHDDADDLQRVVAHQGGECGFFGIVERHLPSIRAVVFAHGAPERIEQIAIVDEGANGTGEALEQKLMDAARGIDGE